MVVYVCIGSSCHLKGSYDVIKQITDLVEENKLEDSVTIKAAFCLGKCTQSVSVRIDEDNYFSVNKDKVNEFFEKEILRRL
ncbi:NAD(P)H-dependent oxidoreductase subunit E [Clostridium sediminicola]